VEYARDNIRCNCICPGWIDTGFNDPNFEEANMDEDQIAAMVKQFVPMNRQGTAADIAPSAAFLASDDAAYIPDTRWSSTAAYGPVSRPQHKPF
jgi:NAD(P)-dependent dehydrogenase (short-subunit alcohol dehydrogenase family)